MSRQFDDWYNTYPRDIPVGTLELEHSGVKYSSLDAWGNYYVNSDGEIVSYKTGHPVVLKTWPNQYGHKYTRIRVGNKYQTISVHREVAKAFVENPENHNVVRHLDDNPRNNCYDNLAWGEQKDNIQDMRDHGRMFLKPVICHETGKIYPSCAAVADEFNVNRAMVTRCCRGEVHSLKGFHFEYYKGEDE